MTRCRVRETGLKIGRLPTGTLNCITDVEGVRVGQTTLVEGEGRLIPGEGPVRTGITVILPHDGNLFREKVHAAVFTINGFGKPLGFEQVRELGVIESPIALTNTLNVGLVADALVQYLVKQSPEIGIQTGSVNVLVGETNDMVLNDLQGRHVRAEHVFQALENASGGPVCEGSVGAGAGTMCYGWKGGIGTASRVLPLDVGGFTVGALVQSNFGSARDLTICGMPVGEKIMPPPETPQKQTAANGGSVMMVLATDAPLIARQLQRLCMRCAAGLARTGAVYGHSSGDFAVAFSTANRVPHQAAGLTQSMTLLREESRVMNLLFLAVAESIEEAVLNSLFCAQTMQGRDGHLALELPVYQVLEFIKGKT